MTRIDFYIIEQGSEEAIKTFICRLTEKAWSQNNSVYIHTMGGQVLMIYYGHLVKLVLFLIKLPNLTIVKKES